MKMRLFLITAISLLIVCTLTAGESIHNFDYSKADSIAINFKEDYSYDTKYLAEKLTANLDTQHEKYRAVFRWIAENIEYKKGKYGKDSEKLLKNGTAVCEGYAALLYEMCEVIGIDCQIIIGYSKTNPGSDIPQRMKETDHAWNAVKIYGKWYLSDITWATSYFNTDTRKYVKDFDDAYFLSDPNFFLLKHYPADKNWMLTDTNFSKSDFKKGPIVYSYYLDFKFKDLEIPGGLIGNKLKISFNTPVQIEKASIVFEKAREPIPVSVRLEEETTMLEYKFEKRDARPFVVFLNGKAVWAFKKD